MNISNQKFKNAVKVAYQLEEVIPFLYQIKTLNDHKLELMDDLTQAYDHNI